MTLDSAIEDTEEAQDGCRTALRMNDQDEKCCDNR